ncbi:hypothetical protein Tco_0705041 [Tanacetum coccineum]|uniref:Uncharacterized protein n=1 Tax=Tanacetum coccineum TaxID=301880 RepID=A0ABQ4Y4B9_9ASTR
MSNNKNNVQTQTSSALHNAIMEAGGKDRPPIVPTDTPTTPGNDGTLEQSREEVMETYATVSVETKKWIDAEAEVIQIILTGIDNDIYSTVDVCPNSMEMWKAIEFIIGLLSCLSSQISRGSLFVAYGSRGSTKWTNQA